MLVDDSVAVGNTGCTEAAEAAAACLLVCNPFVHRVNSNIDREVGTYQTWTNDQGVESLNVWFTACEQDAIYC